MLGIMSTVYSAPSAPEPPHAEPVVAEPAEATADAPAERRTLLQRVPAPLFITAYGAVVIAGVIMAVMLSNYASDAETKSVELEQPRRPFNPAPADAGNVAASVRPHLIENAEVGATETGVMLRGDIPETASPTELSGHLSRLLEQNCLDTVTLTDAEGMRLNFWGFCFSTIPDTTIAEVLSYGEDAEADSVAIYNYATKNNRHEVVVNWVDAGSTEELDKLVKSWRKVSIPDEVDRVVFNAYGDEEVADMIKDRKSGNQLDRNPTGDAFKEKWGL